MSEFQALREAVRWLWSVRAKLNPTEAFDDADGESPDITRHHKFSGYFTGPSVMAFLTSINCQCFDIENNSICVFLF